MVIPIPADITDAFSHLMMVGLASILEDDDSERCCMIRWIDFRQAELITSDDLDMKAVSVIVSNHAKRWSSLKALRSRGEYTFSAEPGDGKGSSPHATMSPRLSALGVPGGWEKLSQDRESAIDNLETWGDYRYFGALGQPSYWSGERNKKLWSDAGASRWEMVTRNQGQEFVQGRLFPLAQKVAERSIKAIQDGLMGTKVVDEAGKNSATSRTATGLHVPSKTDNARAWCALLGVSAFPTWVCTSAGSDDRDPSAALLQLKGPIRFAILPITDRPWTVTKYRSVVRSRALAEFGIEQQRHATDSTTKISPAAEWLREKGVRACVLFNQFVSDNASAPERWLEPGNIVPL